MLADTVQQHVCATCVSLCLGEVLMGAVLAMLEGPAEGDGFAVLCRVDVIP